MLLGVGGTGNLTPLGDLNAIPALKRLPTSPNTGFLQPQFHGGQNASQQEQDGEEKREQSATPHLAVGGLLPPPRPDSGSPIPVAADTHPSPHSLIPGPQHSGVTLGSDPRAGKGPGYHSPLCKAEQPGGDQNRLGDHSGLRSSPSLVTSSPWATLIPLNLGFLICKMGVISTH